MASKITASDLLIEAANSVAEIHEYACNALLREACEAGMRPSEEYTTAVRYLNEFAPADRDDGEAWFGCAHDHDDYAEAQHYRVMMLCFAANIAASEGN